ncbi:MULTISPECIES: hypothetical protein [Shewanella]|uniref:Solute-binding protein family 3/N-terminal domain-containing protein n=1 Tax=Shewanella sedimentimangrovi TaxID=2814293 RepID=A0ABX7QZ17_9GAMM|nr:MULTISPECIES: hypothetical protein [Shewanella]QSX36484.1 hypothetical protein JYB85_14505 [Shewanella sedimentimangrovi]QSX40090.1 hypothetical protein JYB84_14075 [Shewanella cyperi]
MSLSFHAPVAGIVRITALCTLLASGTAMAEHAYPLQARLIADYTLQNEEESDTLAIHILAALERLSQGKLQFENQFAPQSRAWLELTKTDNSCMFNQIKNAEREQKGIYSRYPMILYPPLRLVQAKTNDAEMQPVDLEHFEPQGHIGIIRGRSYGVYLDRIIQTHPEWFYVRSSMDATDRQVQMLVAGHLQALLEYSRTVTGYLNRMHSGFEYTAAPIKYVDQSMKGYIVCSKTARGQAIIDEIDKVFELPQMQAAQLRFHLEYFGDAEARLLAPELKALYRQAASH